MNHTDLQITIATAADLPRMFDVWESSVRASHRFLSEADIQMLIPFVKQELAQFAPIHCIRDSEGQVCAMLGVASSNIEMLFIHAEYRGRGMGRRLVEFAIRELDANRVDVNEQNDAAIGFYEQMGFRTFDRSELDASGHPFPILHMKLG